MIGVNSMVSVMVGVITVVIVIVTKREVSVVSEVYVGPVVTVTVGVITGVSVPSIVIRVIRSSFEIRVPHRGRGWIAIIFLFVSLERVECWPADRVILF
jgi:hypothetical protein